MILSDGRGGRQSQSSIPLSTLEQNVELPPEGQHPRSEEEGPKQMNSSRNREELMIYTVE